MSQPDDREEPLGGEEPGGERPLRPWQEPEQSKKRHLSFWQELALLLGVALVLAVGIKALKNQLSEYVRLAAAGETVLITDRDRIVAELRPPEAGRGRLVEDARRLDLIRRGLLTPARIEDAGPPPRVPIAPLEALLDELARDREDR